MISEIDDERVAVTRPVFVAREYLLTRTPNLLVWGFLIGFAIPFVFFKLLFGSSSTSISAFFLAVGASVSIAIPFLFIVSWLSGRYLSARSVYYIWQGAIVLETCTLLGWWKICVSFPDVRKLDCSQSADQREAGVETIGLDVVPERVLILASSPLAYILGALRVRPPVQLEDIPTESELRRRIEASVRIGG